MGNTLRAGKWRFLKEGFGVKTYWVRNIGTVCVSYIQPGSVNNPSTRPWHLINWGTTHETPEDALLYAIKSYNNSYNFSDSRYEREEALMCGPGRFEQP